MNIGFIGAGRMGTSLACLFANREITISGFYDIDHAKASTAAVSCNTLFFPTSEALWTASDAIFITTNDSAIEAACNEIAAYANDQKKVIFHVSGLLSSSVLESARKAGHYTLSLHPLQSVTGGHAGAQRLENCLFTIEGNDTALNTAQPLLKNCRISVKRILAEQKIAYHTAASIACNHFFSLIATAVELLGQAGFSQQETVNALLPLIQGSIDNLAANGLENAITGPIIRGDIATIQKQMECISKALPDDADMFRKTGNKLVRIAQNAHHINAETAKQISIILEGGL